MSKANIINTKYFDAEAFRIESYIYSIEEQLLILRTFSKIQPVWIYCFASRKWSMLNPDTEIQFDFLHCLYTVRLPEKPPANRAKKLGDIQVFPTNHIQHERIVFDPDQREYYDKHNDIFLSEDDIKFYGLKPYDHITTPLPTPLPENYWDAPTEA